MTYRSLWCLRVCKNLEAAKKESSLFIVHALVLYSLSKRIDEFDQMAESTISRNKRKRSCHVYDEQEDEEEKIHKFYSLIKSIREARNRLINMKGSSDHDHRVWNKELMNTPNKEQKQVHQVWNPSFQREDFMEDHANKLMIKTPLLTVMPSSSSPTLEAAQQKEDMTREELDLTLSL